MPAWLDGARTFADRADKTPAQAEWIVALAVEIAQGRDLFQSTRVQLATVEAYRDTYTTPIEIDPFSVPITAKVDRLLVSNG